VKYIKKKMSKYVMEEQADSAERLRKLGAKLRKENNPNNKKK
jgi:hypothetical protein